MQVSSLCADIDCVFHIAALVGPYHPLEAYKKVNYDGSVNVLNGCKANGVKKIVFSSSPSTRFPYPDPNVRRLTEEDLKRVNGGDYAPVFLQPYAETKAQVKMDASSLILPDPSRGETLSPPLCE